MSGPERAGRCVSLAVGQRDGSCGKSNSLLVSCLRMSREVGRDVTDVNIELVQRLHWPMADISGRKPATRRDGPRDPNNPPHS